MRCHLLLPCVLVCSLFAGESTGPALPLNDGDVVHFVGDSVTTGGGQYPYGYVHLVRQAWNEQHSGSTVQFGWTGYWGAPSEALVKNFPPLLTRDPKPTVVVIMMGLNDSKSGERGLDSYRQHLLGAVAACRSAGIRVALCTPTVWMTLKQTQPYAEVTRELARAEDLPLIDLWSAFETYLRQIVPYDEGEIPHLYKVPPQLDPTRDGVHLGAIGHHLVAKDLLTAFGAEATWQTHVVSAYPWNKDRNVGYAYHGKSRVVVEPAGERFAVGTTITARVEVAEGETFLGWRGMGEGTDNPLTFVVQGPSNIEAIIQYGTGRSR